ncbi:hypothetical protein P154DRAFT_529396 [Amniculicola lignicola CBS 123094]|uniref:F-box domain-containing protein n=1 Tax=Amniculicola lignicola CBS 123094 TaxID=1392246 RepID=A0A6A5X2E0_9PLEO|nr:hypothetical protein P154DRAFT_529396 [Amniculicola lignicola CBS 123094]
MYANLSTLSIRPGRRTMAELFPMFELPTLETLHLDLDNIEPYSNIFLGERVVKEHWNKLKSNVRHISIRILDYSSLYRRPQIARLDLLSSACPLLTSFRFWVRYHARLYDYLYASIYEAFSKQLLTGNLKDIDTSTGSTANWFGRGSPPPPIEPIPPTILQSWQLPKTQLQSLTLDLPWLMRDLANVVPPLPSTLECLTLRYTPDWYNNPGNNATDPMTVELGSGRFSRALTKIAKGFQASLPRLRQLRVVVLPQLLPLAGMVGRTCWEEDEYLRAFVNLSIREPDDGDYYHGKGF